MSEKITRKKRYTHFFRTLSKIFLITFRLYIYHPFPLAVLILCVCIFPFSLIVTHQSNFSIINARNVRKFSFISYNNVIKMVNLVLLIRALIKHAKIKCASSDSVFGLKILNKKKIFELMKSLHIFIYVVERFR